MHWHWFILISCIRVRVWTDMRALHSVRTGQVAGSRPRRQPGHRYHAGQGKCGQRLPLTPGGSCYSNSCPAYGLDIRQSMGWTKVCGTTRSGIWVLKGNARARVLPERILITFGWDGSLSGSIRNRLGYARARLSVFIPVWTWSSRQTTN